MVNDLIKDSNLNRTKIAKMLGIKLNTLSHITGGTKAGDGTWILLRKLHADRFREKHEIWIEKKEKAFAMAMTLAVRKDMKPNDYIKWLVETEWSSIQRLISSDAPRSDNKNAEVFDLAAPGASHLQECGDKSQPPGKSRKTPNTHEGAS